MKMLLTSEHRKLFAPQHLVDYVTVINESHVAQVRWSWVHIQSSLCEELL